MRFFACVIYFLVGIGCSAASPLNPLQAQRDTTPTNRQIQSRLGPKLCKGASIYFPSDPKFGEYIERWSTAVEGDILVVVVASCDNDVANAVSPSVNRVFKSKDY